MQNVWTYAIISLVFLWLLQRWRDRRYIWLCTKFPTKWLQWLTGFGHLLTSEGTIKVITEAHEKYGLSLNAYVGPHPVLVTADPVIISDVFKQCTKKPDFFYCRLTNAFGRGLITLSDPSWSHERKIISPTFNNKNLMTFIPIFNEEVNRVMTQIDKDTSELNEKPIINYFREFTLRIATRTTIGRNIDKTNCSAEQIAEATNEFMQFSVELMLNNIYALSPIRYLARLTYFKNACKMITDMRCLITETFMCSSIKRSDDPSYENSIKTAVDYMAKGYEQQRISAEYVTDDIFHLYLGAFETTSTSLYFILLLLGMHPECQQRAYEEICTLFPDDDDGDFNVTYEDIQQLVYLEMVINETMRVLPIVPQIARQTSDDLTLSNGIILPKAQCVVISIYNVHRSMESWGPNANKFNPDNFLPSNTESRHPYAFIPFTKGLRFCIGWRYAQLSIKVALAKLIKRYKFTAYCKLEDLHLENHVTAKIRENPPVILERRK